MQHNYCETEHVFPYDSHVSRVRPCGSTEFCHPLHTPCCCRNQPGNRPDCIHNCTDTLHCLEAHACQLFFCNWHREAGTMHQRSCMTFLSLYCGRLACWRWRFFRGWVGTVALWWGGLQTQVVTLCGLLERRRRRDAVPLSYEL